MQQTLNNRSNWEPYCQPKPYLKIEDYQEVYKHSLCITRKHAPSRSKVLWLGTGNVCQKFNSVCVNLNSLQNFPPHFIKDVLVQQSLSCRTCMNSTCRVCDLVFLTLTSHLVVGWWRKFEHVFPFYWSQWCNFVTVLKPSCNWTLRFAMQTYKQDSSIYQFILANH